MLNRLIIGICDDEQKSIDILLLDIEMTGMNGIEKNIKMYNGL